MTLSLLDYFILVGSLLAMILFGVYYGKTVKGESKNFFLGGQNLPWWIAGTSMVATTFAADTPLAVTELVAKYGISGNWLWWNALAGGMLTTFFFAKLWRRSGVMTDLEFIEIRYAGKPAAFLRGFRAIYLGLFMNALIIAWVNVALMGLLKVFFGLDGAQLLLVTGLAMALTALYSATSGLLGIAMTDLVQFCVAIAGTIILSVVVVNSEQIGGIEGLKQSLPEWRFDFLPSIGSSTGEGLALGLGSFFAYIGIQWWASWYPGAEPGGGGYVAQRILSTKNEQHALGAALYFQIAHYCLRPWPWILVALCSVVLYPDLPESESKLGYVMAMRDFLPTGLKGLLLVAFFSAYMSTISTQLNWGTSYLVHDFFGRFFIKDPSKHVGIARITTVFLMLFGLGVTTLVESISGVWLFLIECGAGLGLVLILRWYWWRINAWSEIAANITPLIAHGVARLLLDLEFPESFFFTVGITTVVWPTITLLTRPEPSSLLQSFYDRIRPGGFWGRFESDSSGGESTKMLMAQWGLGIVSTYSALFLIGSLVLAKSGVWMYLASFSVSTFALFGLVSAQKKNA